jgi:hypothetical protein
LWNKYGKKGARTRQREERWETEREREGEETDLEMLLDLLRICDSLGGGHVHADVGAVVGLLVHVGEDDGGADGGPVVDAGAAVAMAAGADLEVEGAVDAVLLGAEDGSEMLRHSPRLFSVSLCSLLFCSLFFSSSRCAGE